VGVLVAVKLLNLLLAGRADSGNFFVRVYVEGGASLLAVNLIDSGLIAFVLGVNTLLRVKGPFPGLFISIVLVGV
jgi:hypothetical protein